MKTHDGLQIALAITAGFVAFVLWSRFESDFHADAARQAARDVAGAIADWVHGLRAAMK